MISSAFLTLPLLVSLSTIPRVSAHGWLGSVTIGSQTFVGNVPNASPTGTVIRQIDDVDPVKGASNAFLNCGQNAQLASDVAQANPGDTVAFTWVNGDDGPWVHNTGPMQTYMASCGSEPCSSFDSSSASWFKIQEQGRITPGGDWAMSLMNSGAPANVTIPSNIAPGNYLIRHELIALQIAQTEGGAEFYPACVQVSIGGEGTGTPTDEELVQLPGAYSDTDPGILVDVYSNPDADYVFPGPAVAAFVSGSTDSSSSDSSSSSSAVSASASSTATAAASSSTTSTSGSCKKRRSVPAVDAVEVPVARPRQLSRVMKSLL